MDWTTKERRGAQEPQGGRAIHRSQLQPAPARPGALGSAGEGEEAATCPPTSPNPANSVMGQDRSQAARRSGQPTVQQFIITVLGSWDEPRQQPFFCHEKPATKLLAKPIFLK